MPIYEYECEKCHTITEAWQSISDDPLTTCPDCQGALKKLISSSTFQLKGGGWYADGYSSTKPAACNTATKSDSSSTSCNSGASCPCTS